MLPYVVNGQGNQRELFQTWQTMRPELFAQWLGSLKNQNDGNCKKPFHINGDF